MAEVYDFNRYAAGDKVYKGTQRSPNSGMKLDKSGYIQRSVKAKTQKRAAMRRLRDKATKNFMRPEWLRHYG